MVRRWLGEVRGLPVLMQVGLLVFAAGGLLDLLSHAAPSPWTETLERYLGEDAVLAHLITLAGMVITMLGIFARRVFHGRHA
ncbi:MAG: hypothetical protein HY689_03395 [Chloroflexi bacterium]|nr:hypothetical protein [Chloroflexota bacterium]